MTAGRMLHRAALTGMLLAVTAAVGPALLATPAIAQQSEVLNGQVVTFLAKIRAA